MVVMSKTAYALSRLEDRLKDKKKKGKNKFSLQELIMLGEEIMAYKFFADPFKPNNVGQAPSINPKRINPNQGTRGRFGSKPAAGTKGFTFGKNGKPVQLLKESSNEQESVENRSVKDYSDDWRDKISDRYNDVSPRSKSRMNVKRKIVRVEKTNG